MKSLMVVGLFCALSFGQATNAQQSPASSSPQTPAMSQPSTSPATAQPTSAAPLTRDVLVPGTQAYDRISQEVRHELVMLPRYGVFDDLRYEVSADRTVTLSGYVVDPTLKEDSARAVKHIEGVENVVNNIQVLPTSFNDDRLRRQVFRAIYGNEVLSQYELRAIPPIHIIVNNGHVTLTGVVARTMDKQIAEMQAKSVPGVFSVDDQLQVENPSS